MIVNPGIRRFLGSAIQRLFNSASFYAPLTHSLVPERGTGSPTFTRATTATVRDHEGVLRTAIAGEARFEGARRVRNLFSTTTADLSNAAWAKFDMTVTTGHPDPDGGTTAMKLVEAAGGAIYPQVYQVDRSSAGQMVLLWCVAKAAERNWLVVNNNDGVGSFRTWFDLTNGVIGTDTTGAATIDSLGDGWYLCAVPKLCSSSSGNVAAYQVSNQDNGGAYAGDGTSGIYIWHPQLEDITGRTDQTTPSEYVSVGVLSAPYHGSMVDGVRCFPTDLSGNPLPTQYTYDAVSLNGVAGTYVSTPDSVAASITGDIDIRWYGTTSDWTPAAASALLDKFGSAGTRSWQFGLDSTGVLFLWLSSDGTANTVYPSTVAVTAAPHSFAANAYYYCRATRSSSSGTIEFYTSTDGATWTQLGTDVASTAGALIDNAEPVRIGHRGAGSDVFSGSVRQAQIYNGINGTLAVDFDASRYAGGTTLTGSTGETWTLNGNAVIHPTNSPMLGYLAEGARTNLCLQSQTFDNASWVKMAGGGASVPVVTANQTIAPDGTLTADKVVFVAPVSGDISSLYQAPVLAAGTYTGAIYVKAFAAGDIGKKLGFRHAAGAAYSLITLTADWQRFSSTEVRAANNFDITLRPSEGTSSGTVSCYIWGAQLELGSFASSYIATTTIAVARNADVLTYSSAGNVSTTSGAMYMETVVAINQVAPQLIVHDALANNYFSMDDGGAAAGALRTLVSSGGAITANFNTGSSSANTVVKRAMSWEVNSVDGCINGTLGVRDTSCAMPLSITTISVGGAGTPVGASTFRNIRAFGRKLSPSELQAVTS